MRVVFPIITLVLTAAASPISKRAGGPAAVPIPSNCTVVEPLPHADTQCGTGNICGTAGVSGFNVTAEFSSGHRLYAAYFESSLSQQDQWTECIEQCYGYGEDGQCKSAWLAYNAPTPPGYYGTAGGALETACVLFDDYLTPLDFEAGPADNYVNETAGSIYCPAGTVRPS